ncbi:hypothetical protein [Pelagibius sp.]|uniref:hypothetical protein n=1 Tax=Pelagibius sp. TaxID=1931238 RepID=UPI00261EF91C|nr:hypothetical protein [Pelagibius sp.]
MQALTVFLSVTLLIAATGFLPGRATAGPAGTSAAPAHDEAPAEDAAAVAPAGPSGASPWEHDLWAGATTMMRIYVCTHARRPPSWCAEGSELPSKAELPEQQGPPLTAEDAAWLAFLDQADPDNLSAEDIAVIERRATGRRDPQAMEILGYLYVQGVSVERNYAEAYRWYGRAYLAGEKRVRANMDVVWMLLQKHDLNAALALTREFNALSAEGDAPPAVEADPTGR